MICASSGSLRYPVWLGSASMKRVYCPFMILLWPVGGKAEAVSCFPREFEGFVAAQSLPQNRLPSSKYCFIAFPYPLAFLMRVMTARSSQRFRVFHDGSCLGFRWGNTLPPLFGRGYGSPWEKTIRQGQALRGSRWGFSVIHRATA